MNVNLSISNQEGFIYVCSQFEFWRGLTKDKKEDKKDKTEML